MIQTKNLHIGYKTALLQVEDFTLQAGAYILVGQNGSGKSTFLKTISGQLQPVSGEVWIDGKNISDVEPIDLPRTIAFVSAHFPMVDFLRVYDYVGLGRSGHTSYFGTLKERDREIIEKSIATIGIEHLQHRFTNELSDGERQLVAVARAFAQESPVIALDEPTAFLDYKNKGRLLSKLIELGEKFGKCVVLSSHDIDQSLDAGCPFLVVDPKAHKLELIEGKTDKNTLLLKAFG